jgi:hypothetical protein
MLSLHAESVKVNSRGATPTERAIPKISDPEGVKDNFRRFRGRTLFAFVPWVLPTAIDLVPCGDVHTLVGSPG